MATTTIAKSGGRISIKEGSGKAVLFHPAEIPHFGFDAAESVLTVVIRGRSALKIALADLLVADSEAAPESEAAALTALAAVFV